MARKNKIRKLLVPTLGFVLLATGCGGDSDCDPLLNAQDPAGRWKGVLTRQESDCATRSKGASFAFDHEVWLDCSSDGGSRVSLLNGENLYFSETSFNDFGGGSFSVQSRKNGVTIDISYDNFDGSLADVTQKIRVYANDKIVCSEKYTGRARR
jgi:hypothetical protein